MLKIVTISAVAVFALNSVALAANVDLNVNIGGQPAPREKVVVKEKVIVKETVVEKEKHDKGKHKGHDKHKKRDKDKKHDD